MREANLRLIAVICAATAAVWVLGALPVLEPIGDLQVHGYAYAPSRTEPDQKGNRVTEETTIAGDLALLAEHADAVRTYTVAGAFAQVPALAETHELSVSLGAWLVGQAQADRAELARLVEVARRSRSVERLVVGNETLLHGRLTVEQLTAYLDVVRARSDLPVTTAEPWHVWLQYPRLAGHVDLIMVHLLPYWEGVPSAAGVAHLFQRLRELREAFPDKPVILGEVGWPSRGNARGAAVASERDQARFLRQFLNEAERQDLEYFLMEAFDQPWKAAIEGTAGAYWGLFDQDRDPRAVIAGTAREVPALVGLAVLSAMTAVFFFLLLSWDSAALRLPGRLWLASAAAVLGNTVVWGIHAQVMQYWTPSALAVGWVMAIAGTFAVVTMLVELHEWVESRWGGRSRLASAQCLPLDALPDFPMVSIHIPAHNEPPAMLADTLQALAALDYPRFEVLVVDNNTSDERQWRPIEALCARLGEHFRFMHVDGLAGYKAGALNLALLHTDPAAQLVAVIDSDYQVRRDWLHYAVRHFRRADVALVQAPQDYRDGDQSLFKAACVAEYATFFNTGMVTRNERNAIVQHGTMTIVRRDVLQAEQGWAEWCICEDAELGLRILAAGHESVYLAESYGHGVSPDSFEAYRTQRYRWAFGAAQIMRAHAGMLLGRHARRLTPAQRYHFVAGWLPWLADGLSLVASVFALVWTALMLLFPDRLGAPPAPYTVLPLALFALRLAKSFDLQLSCNGVGMCRAVQGTVAGLALTPTVGRAVLSACSRTELDFVRTPKLVRACGVPRALRSVRWESFFAAVLLACAASVDHAVPQGGLEVNLWRSLLLAFALPHLAAVIMALVAAAARSEDRLNQPIGAGSGLINSAGFENRAEPSRVRSR